MGYDINLFVEPVSDDFKCQICLKVLEYPRQCANCRNCFWLSWIEEHIEKNKTCPIDNKPLSIDQLLLPPYELKATHGSLKMRCKENWGTIVTIDKLFAHEVNCQFGQVTCEFWGQEMSKEEYYAHREIHKTPSKIKAARQGEEETKVQDKEEDLDVTAIHSSVQEMIQQEIQALNEYKKKVFREIKDARAEFTANLEKNREEIRSELRLEMAEELNKLRTEMHATLETKLSEIEFPESTPFLPPQMPKPPPPPAEPTQASISEDERQKIFSNFEQQGKRMTALESQTKAMQDNVAQSNAGIEKLRGELAEQAKDMDFICEQSDKNKTDLEALKRLTGNIPKKKTGCLG